MILYSGVFRKGRAKGKNGREKIGEKRKKFLTTVVFCDILKKLSAKSGKQPVPCKLNNAKTNKHLDNYGLLKRFRTNNSQRKFLSIFARQIIQKLDLERFSECFRYNFLRV